MTPPMAKEHQVALQSAQSSWAWTFDLGRSSIDLRNSYLAEPGCCLAFYSDDKDGLAKSCAFLQTLHTWRADRGAKVVIDPCRVDKPEESPMTFRLQCGGVSDVEIGKKVTLESFHGNPIAYPAVGRADVRSPFKDGFVLGGDQQEPARLRS